MPDLDRMVGDLRCRDVLELLADYVDDALPLSLLERVNVHLADCDACEKFGGEYGAVVARLRAAAASRLPDPGVRVRLGERMSRFWGG